MSHSGGGPASTRHTSRCARGKSKYNGPPARTLGVALYRSNELPFHLKFALQILATPVELGRRLFPVQPHRIVMNQVLRSSPGRKKNPVRDTPVASAAQMAGLL